MASKIISGLKQALKFARADCVHEWRDTERPLMDGRMRECAKCGVRVTLSKPAQ